MIQYKFIFCLLALSRIIHAQIADNTSFPIEKKIFLFKLKNERIKITATTSNLYYDTLTIIVDKISNDRNIRLQKFRTSYSHRLLIKTISFKGTQGFIIENDGKYGRAELYLFDKIANKLINVNEFSKLGRIETLTIKGNKYHYSYISCGCSDDCWASVLFDIKTYKISKIASLRCDCEKILNMSGSQENILFHDCKFFNDRQKFEHIKNYWVSLILKKLKHRKV